MEKAYDVGELLEILKSKGVVIAEDLAEQSFAAFMEWIRQSAALSSTPYDDMALGFLTGLETKVKEAIDKIDGEEG